MDESSGAGSINAVIHTVGYTIRALPNGRSHVSICVFGAVHLVVEATLDSETSRLSPPATLVRRNEGGEDKTVAPESVMHHIRGQI